jgi:hypothetical protein
MSALLQSLFEMKEARANSRIHPLGTVDVMLPAGAGAASAGLESWVPSGSPSALEEGGGGLGAAWPAPSRMQPPAEAPLSHPSPPSEPFHLGLLRVTGAKASGRPTALLGSGGGGAGKTMTGAAAPGSLARLRGETPDDRHDFVRDLRRQFELRQQRAYADGNR